MNPTGSAPPSVRSGPRSDLVDLVCTALALAGSVLGLLIASWAVAVLAAVPSLLADLLRGPRPARLVRLERLLPGPPSRALVRLGAAGTAVAALAPAVLPGGAALLALVPVLPTALAGADALRARRRSRERTRITWRHLDVGGAEAGPGALPDPVRARLPLDAAGVLGVAEVLLLAGLVLAAVRAPVLPTVLAGVAVVLVAGTTALLVRAWGPRGTPPRDTDPAVARAVEALAPEVVLAFSSPPSGSYALAVWAAAVNAIDRPVLVVLREAGHLSAAAAITRPTVVAPTTAELRAVVPDSVRAVLHPANVARNGDLIRIPGPMHAFIGHGDSDKLGSISPLNRMYDEIWVAGRAGADRYASVDEGIDPSAIRLVGRPQLAEIARVRGGPGAGARPTVLYAPTWEGFFDAADYSSVASMGERIVTACAEAGAVVLFKPHPFTGHRSTAAGRAARATAAAVRRGGGEVLPRGPEALYAGFGRADVLVSDVSSVITDFLASRKPYLVTNPRGLPDAAFVAAFPSASAAALLAPDLATLPAALADALGPDRHRAGREALAEQLLGDEEDPMRAFLDAVDALVDRASARLAGEVRG